MLSGSNFAIWGAIVAVLVVAAYFLYGTGGAGVHEGRLEVRDPPAVLDKLQITQQAAGPRRGRGWRRGEGRRGQGREQGREQRRRGGGPAVQAVWSDANGNPVRLDDYRGRLVVLNLWATWCAPCITELPALARAKAQLAGDGVAVIAVDLEKKSAADIAAFLKQHGADGLGVAIDNNLTLMRAYGAYGLPLTIVIDRRGREFARAFGPQKWDDPEAIAYLRDVANARPAYRGPRGGRGRGMFRGLRHLGH